MKGPGRPRLSPLYDLKSGQALIFKPCLAFDIYDLRSRLNGNIAYIKKHHGYQLRYKTEGNAIRVWRE